MSKTKQRTKPTLEETLDLLTRGEQTPGAPPARLFYGLSELTATEAEKVRPTWQALSVEYRRKVIMAMAELSESDFELDFTRFAYMVIHDEDAQVRVGAIESLWVDENLVCMQVFMRHLAEDPDERVKAAAASALGRFVLLGEYDDITADDAREVHNLLLDTLRNPLLDVQVRRRALESVAYATHPDIAQEIRKAYATADHLWQVSAVFAMGRTGDNQWDEIVLKELENDNDEMRYEAARSAGELTIVSAVPGLARLLIENDREIQEVSVWALGEIGGREAQRILEQMIEVAEANDDDVLLEAVEDALANLGFVGGLTPFDLD